MQQENKEPNKQTGYFHTPHLKGFKMEYPKFLKNWAKENGLEIVGIVEDNYQEKTSFFAIFEGEYGQETRRIEENKEIVFGS